MADGQSVKTDSKPPIASPHQNQVHPYGGQEPPPGYNGPQHSGQPGPVTSQPGPGQSFGYHSSNTTVVVTQQQVPTRPSKRGWSTGICGCFEDFGSCCAVALCPQCYVCYLSSKLGESCCLPVAIGGPCALIPLRTKIRAENGIYGSICEDCCMVCWCSQCVMCQLSRKKGPQPSIAIPNQVQPYGGEELPNGYCAPQYSGQPGYSGPQYSGQPGPVTGQPGPGQPFGYHSSNTTVVVTQQQVPTRPRKRGWSTGICGCFEDFGSCCAVFFCPQFYMCYLSSKLGESCCLPCAISGTGALIPLRTKIRAENNIHGSICEDCCMVCWCPQCVMCQLSREYDNIHLNHELTIQ